MIEPYQWLIAQAKKLGYDPANVGPASVDLCLGDVAQCYGWTNEVRFDTVIPTKETGYKFISGYFYLCSTVEYIKVPISHCAFINMRSSLARKGLGHRMAGFIDPGFEGQVTLELETIVPLTVQHGERVVQLIYMRLTEPTAQPYDGRYKGQRGPTEAYA